jgi:hypothetical protein
MPSAVSFSKNNDPPALVVSTPAVVFDFDLELAVAVLMLEDPFAMTVLEKIVAVMMPAAVVEEEVSTTLPAPMAGVGIVEVIVRTTSSPATGIVEQIIRTAFPAVPGVESAATVAGAAALGQQDGFAVQRSGLQRNDTGGPENHRQQ